MGSIKTISIIVAANIKGLEVGLGKANKSLAKFASGAARMGSLLSFGVTAPLTALGKSAFDTFSKFENGMMKVNTVTGATVGEFKMLTDEAKRLGATTQFTALQVADLQLVLGRKGFDPTAIKNMEKSILDLALATGEDLSLAAETVSASINAFGLESDQAARVSNTLASAAANSSIQLSTFSTAFGHAGASANAVGVDLEELSAMMGILMDNGIKASKAGTGLRTAFSKLNEEGIPFSLTLEKLASGQMTLNQATKLVGRTGANQLLILANNKDKVKELTKEYQTNTGRLREMADMMSQTTHARVKKMQSAIESMKIEMGALISDAITPIIAKVTDLASGFSNLDEGTKKLILKVGGFLTVLGPLLLSFGAIVSLLNPFTVGLLALGGAFVALNSTGSKQLTFLEKEKSELNALVGVLKTTGDGTEKRKRLIGEINEKYPTFLENLDQEKITNDQLTIALDSANKEYIKKIELKAREVELTNAVNKKLKTQRDLESKEKKGLLELNDLREKQGIGYVTNISVLDNLSGILGGAIVRSSSEAGKSMGAAFVELANGSIISERLFNKLSTLKGELSKSNSEFEDASKVVNDYASEITELGIALDGGVTSTSTSTNGGVDGGTTGTNDDSTSPLFSWMEGDILANYVRDYAAAMTQMEADTQRLKNSVKEMGLAMAQQFAGSVANIIVSGGNLLQGLGQIFKDLAKQIMAMVIKAALLAAILSLTGLGPTAQAAGGIFKGGTGFKDILGGMMGGSFASGGNPPVGKVSLVGEQGPELFVPNSSGTIIPNHALSGGSTSTVIPDVRITGDDLLIVFDRANRRKNRR